MEIEIEINLYLVSKNTKITVLSKILIARWFGFNFDQIFFLPTHLVGSEKM